MFVAANLKFLQSYEYSNNPNSSSCTSCALTNLICLLKIACNMTINFLYELERHIAKKEKEVCSRFVNTQETIMNRIVVALVLLNCATADRPNYSLIKDYLEWSHIKAILFVTCERPTSDDLENIKIYLKKNDIYLNHWDISSDLNVSSFNYKQFFTRLTYPICIALNWECNQRDWVLKELSKRILFHYERTWLIYGSSSIEQIFKRLSEEYINVDAEISVVEAVGDE